MKICTLDIETTDLSAIGAGWVVCAVVKPLGAEAKVFRYDRLGCKLAHENKLIESIFKAIAPFNLVVGHNIERFDWLYLKSRAIVLGVPLPKPPVCYDTMFAARRVGIKTTINSFTGKSTVALDHVIDFFGIDQFKTKIYPRKHWDTVWKKDAKEGRRAMKDLVTHCVDDVAMTEAIYWRLLEHDPRPKLTRVS